jgi:hypothetical protein
VLTATAQTSRGTVVRFGTRALRLIFGKHHVQDEPEEHDQGQHENRTDQVIEVHITKV